MLSPDYLLHCSEPAEMLSSELHEYIISEIVKRIMVRAKRGEDYILTSRDKWQLETLRESGFLYEDLQKEIAERSGLMREEVKEAFEDAGVRAIDYDNRIYEKAGIDALPLNQSPHLIRLMERSYTATSGAIQNLTRTTADISRQLFINTLDKIYNQVTSGAVSYSQAFADAVNEICRDGVYVVYKDALGEVYHTDTIETATLRALRTGISQATGQIQEARMKEFDWDIVLVSAHLGARDTGDGYLNHASWQGKFYSRTGKDERFPDFVSSTGYGTGGGLCGWNCRHSFGAGDGEDNPYDSIDLKENHRIYELTQKQREMERKIRERKRELQGLKTGIDNAPDQDVKAKLQKRYDKVASILHSHNNAYNEFCAENELRPLADRIKVAKWDRKYAAQARIRAKKYEENNKMFKIIEKGNDTVTYDTFRKVRSGFKNEIDVNLYSMNKIGIEFIEPEKIGKEAMELAVGETSRVYEIFGNLRKEKTLIDFKLAPREMGCYAAYDPINKTILLKNVSDGEYIERLKRDAVKQKKIGFWSTDAVEHSIRHELGHAVWAMKENPAYGILNSVDMDKKERIDKIRLDIMNKCGIIKWSLNDTAERTKRAGDYISYVALMNHNEMIAESIAEYLNGSPREIALKIVSIILEG